MLTLLSMNSIELRGLFKSYGNRELFNGLDAKFVRGTITAINGRSGAGKTTLINILFGFDFPEKGSIEFNAKNASPSDFKTLRKMTGYVPQNVNTIGKGVVKDVILQKFEFKANKSQIPSEHSILDMLKRLGLPRDILYSGYSDISGGEKQRVAIVITLLADKSVLIYDEPTSGLDDFSKDMVANIISELKNKIIILSSHDSKLTTVCSNIITLGDTE